MKRLLHILLILVPLFLLAVWLAKRPARPWNVKTQMTFLGLTNAVAGAPPTNALFGFNEIPSGNASWQAFLVGQFDGINWVFPEKPYGYYFTFFQPGGNFNGGPTNYFLRGTIGVRSTSDPTRVVMCLTRGPSGRLEKLWFEAKQKVARLLRLKEPGPTGGDGAQYFMTNDFNFSIWTPPPP